MNGINERTLDAMNHEEVLAVLPDSREDAKAIKEIAQAMGLEVSSMWNRVRAERRLVRALGALSNGAGLPVTIDRKKKATSSGTTPTGKRSWQSISR